MHFPPNPRHPHPPARPAGELTVPWLGPHPRGTFHPLNTRSSFTVPRPLRRRRVYSHDRVSGKPGRFIVARAHQIEPFPWQTPHFTTPEPSQCPHSFEDVSTPPPTRPVPLHFGQVVPPLPPHVLHVAILISFLSWEARPLLAVLVALVLPRSLAPGGHPARYTTKCGRPLIAPAIK